MDFCKGGGRYLQFLENRIEFQKLEIEEGDFELLQRTFWNPYFFCVAIYWDKILSKWGFEVFIERGACQTRVGWKRCFTGVLHYQADREVKMRTKNGLNIILSHAKHEKIHQPTLYQTKIAFTIVCNFPDCSLFKGEECLLCTRMYFLQILNN